MRNHPTYLESIEDKSICKVSVGGSFAFAIGKTMNRIENSIFDEAGNRSQLSGIQRDEATRSNLLSDMKINDDQQYGAPEVRSNNRSMNSLEEQL